MLFSDKSAHPSNKNIPYVYAYSTSYIDVLQLSQAEIFVVAPFQLGSNCLLGPILLKDRGLRRVAVIEVRMNQQMNCTQEAAGTLNARGIRVQVSHKDPLWGYSSTG